MSSDRCAHCGVLIEEMGLEYKGLLFCSDDCCEEYEDNLLTNGEPDPAELNDEELKDLDLEDITFEEDSDLDDDLDEEYCADEY